MHSVRMTEITFPCASELQRALPEYGIDRDISATSDERGDVPGWVLITLMTAGLVVVIWAMAGPALSGVFTDAIERVTNF